MTYAIFFILGFVWGWGLCSLCVISKHSDEEVEEFREIKEKPK